MKTLIAAAALALAATPALAALKVGDTAPDFAATGFQAGKALNFELASARKKGPVVLYFFPGADTPGCNIEAKMFADAIGDFQAQKATVIGVTAGKLDQLQKISADNDKCSGKFPVLADPGAKIAKQYDSILPAKPDWSDRTSYVIAPNGKILHVHSKMDPTQHVSETLAAVKEFRGKK
jgi:thioredoxin-dependent peroxiredoxin